VAEFRTIKIEKHQYTAFLDKATSFYNGMIDAKSRGNWVQACSSAVHCTISSCDAVTTYFLGERSASIRHDDLARLVQRISLPDADEKSKQIAQVLSVKSRVEYSAETLSQKQALTMTLQAGRIYEWARQITSK
jgi:hypothetical protein